MNFLEAFKIAFAAIWSNKMRSFLTMLGLIIGISSVITIVSLGNGTQAQLEESFSTLGVNNVTISLVRDNPIAPGDYLKESDIDFLMEEFAAIDYIVPQISASGTLQGNVDSTAITLSGASETVVLAEDLDLLAGRGINAFDLNGYKKVMVMDSDLATELFGSEDAVGETVMVATGRATHALTVIGVYESEESLQGFSGYTGYVPYKTLMMINNTTDFYGLTLTYHQDVDQGIETAKVLSALGQAHDNTDRDMYESFSPESLLEMVNSTMGMVTLFISAIAAISLVVGGIGVMNIMLVSVTERTREIGIRKALGAKYRDIMVQFLIEAITVSLLGGVIGVIVGGGLTTLVGNLIDIPATLSFDALLMAFGFSISIGIFFGIYPADKAAKLDPIVALRHE